MAVIKIPTVDIGGASFYVDSRLQEFRQVDNPFNTIGFEECQQNEKGIELRFDLDKKTLFHGSQEEMRDRRGQVKLIQLAPIWKLDPLGFIQHRSNLTQLSHHRGKRM